jgi:hypothetical protein
MKKALLVSALAGGLLLGAQNASAHCDSLDGPVATAALNALQAHNVNLVCQSALKVDPGLEWAPWSRTGVRRLI